MTRVLPSRLYCRRIVRHAILYVVGGNVSHWHECEHYWYSKAPRGA